MYSVKNPVMPNIFLTSALLLCSILFSAEALAVKPFTPTPAEIRMLPPYCVAKLGGGDPAMGTLWKQRIGAENFLHLHHYCYALNFMNRARFEPNKNDRIHYLNEAINNFDYVLQRWPQNFKLSVSARSYKSQAELMRSQ